MDLALILMAVAAVAMVYASVGHGGASGYLAIMALWSFSPEVMRPSALILNLFVAGIAFVLYYRKGYFNFSIFLPLALGSVPMAFLGGRMSIDPTSYKIILGVCLLFAVIRILGFPGIGSRQIRGLPFYQGVVIGAGLGFVSGLIGIGGGIILSPLLLIFRWADVKTTAAVSALFILFNSFSALSGIYLSGNFESLPHLYLWIIVALLAGSIGAYLGSAKVSGIWLRRMLATVLLFASFKLIFL